jgi:hypothetical protein
MLSTIRTSAATVAALFALALGGAALAGATDNPSTSGSSSDAARSQREALSSDLAAKVKAAALDKVPGATVLRTEAGGPYATAYHAHIRTSGRALQVVLVNADFEATAVQADRRAGARGGRHGGAGEETALTGDTKAKVEDAVKARYPGATIVRSETNNDSSAPYEAHIRTSAGQELEILVSASFAVVDARERPARP